MDTLNQRLDNYFRAIREKNLENLQAEIKNNPSLVNEAEIFFGFTPLMLASRLGHMEIANTLIQRIIKDDENGLNKTNKLGQTALNLALSNGHADLADCLIIAGADKNIADNKGRSAETIAGAHGYTMQRKTGLRA